MKLVTFEVDTLLGRFTRLGAMTLQEYIVDLNAVYAAMLAEDGEPQAQRLADVIVPADMRCFIEMGPRALDAAHDAIAYSHELLSETDKPLGLNQARLTFHPNEIRLKTPLPEPNMFRDFYAFEQHVSVGYKLRQEPIPESWYKIPVYYKGNHRSLIGPDEPVQWPSYTRKLDYELEWACIIGMQGRNIPVSEAADYIFGYTIVNDFSARDIQKHEMRCRLGPAKGKDFGTAIGPCIVTREEIAHPYNLTMTAKINGQEHSRGNSGDVHFHFEEMIHHLSQEETIYPGDILASGTVGTGCGLENGYWLQPDDEIVLTVEGIGELRNRILPPKAQTNLLEAFPEKRSKITT